jgi:hypothetical protein
MKQRIAYAAVVACLLGATVSYVGTTPLPLQSVKLASSTLEAADGSAAEILVQNDFVEVSWPRMGQVVTYSSLYEDDADSSVIHSGALLRVSRGADARMYAVTTTAGSYTIYAPPTPSDEFDAALAYAYSPDETLLGWNSSSWPARSEVRLGGTLLPLTIGTGYVSLTEEVLGAGVEMREGFSDEILAYGDRLLAAMPTNPWDQRTEDDYAEVKAQLADPPPLTREEPAYVSPGHRSDAGAVRCA